MIAGPEKAASQARGLILARPGKQHRAAFFCPDRSAAFFLNQGQGKQRAADDRNNRETWT